METETLLNELQDTLSLLRAISEAEKTIARDEDLAADVGNKTGVDKGITLEQRSKVVAAIKDKVEQGQLVLRTIEHGRVLGPSRYTSISMQAAMSPEGGELHFEGRDGELILLECQRLSFDWIYGCKEVPASQELLRTLVDLIG